MHESYEIQFQTSQNDKGTGRGSGGNRSNPFATIHTHIWMNKNRIL